MSFSAGREPKIVVLDDDPTGIQMVHDVAVYTCLLYTSEADDE